MLQDKIVKNQEITGEEGIRSLKSHGKLQGKQTKKTDMRFKGFLPYALHSGGLFGIMKQHGQKYRG